MAVLPPHVKKKGEEADKEPQIRVLLFSPTILIQEEVEP